MTSLEAIPEQTCGFSQAGYQNKYSYRGKPFAGALGFEVRFQQATLTVARV